MIAHDLFSVGVPILEKVIRTVAVYAGIVALLRLGGKRELAQLNSFDLTVLLLLSNVVQNAVIGSDNSLEGGLIGAVVLVAVNGVVVRLVRRNKTTMRIFEGGSTVLVADGRVDVDTLHRLGLREPDVVTAVRRQGASDLQEVQRATLEPGGSIAVELRPEAKSATAGDIGRLERKLDALLAGAR
jgi:uncharacterized membrane protein YcaP (DUF421 family)